MLHTAQWDPAVDLRGKRVAVIGTGASAMQFVPAAAEDAAEVRVFQRTPQWAMPPSAQRAAGRRLGALAEQTRAVLSRVVSRPFVLADGRQGVAPPAGRSRLSTPRARDQQGKRPTTRHAHRVHRERTRRSPRPSREEPARLSAVRKATADRRRLVPHASPRECPSRHHRYQHGHDERGSVLGRCRPRRRRAGSGNGFQVRRCSGGRSRSVVATDAHSERSGVPTTAVPTSVSPCPDFRTSSACTAPPTPTPVTAARSSPAPRCRFSTSRH